VSDHWVTKEEEERISKEFRYLNSVDPKTGLWRDLALMYFSPDVLEKYRPNSRCDVGKNYISFLAPRRDEDLTVNFEVINGKLMVQSKYFCFVPPSERKCWEKYQLPDEGKLSGDYKLR
jgi:hypothetical protein